MSKDLLEQLKNMDKDTLLKEYVSLYTQQQNTQRELDESRLENEFLKDQLKLKSSLPFIPSTEKSGQFELLFDQESIKWTFYFTRDLFLYLSTQRLFVAS